MALINCSKCNEQISESVKYCKNCGEPVQKQNVENVDLPTMKKLNVGCLITIVIGIFLFVALFAKCGSADKTPNGVCKICGEPAQSGMLLCYEHSIDAAKWNRENKK